MATADLNGGGKLDLVTANLGSNGNAGISVLLGSVPVPVYSIADASTVAEGDKLVFTVTSTTAAAGDVTISTDHGDVLIRAGETTGSLEVQTTDDHVYGTHAPDVTVTLQSASVGSIDPDHQTATGHTGDAKTDPVYFSTVSHDVHSPAGEVYALYNAIFDRPTDRSGQWVWTEALAHGATRAQVAVGIAESPETYLHLQPQIEAGWHLV
ncbi:MAG: DUF4214 domain-containing protein [Acetobacteraceae bacterium]|nr:DUF4214 domain-containing protein [Acetobacteraceae bacterium]